jgi:Tol biopolymer transport system component
MMKRNFVLSLSFLATFGLFSCTMDVRQPSSATPLPEVLSPTSPTPNANNTPHPSRPTIPITWADLNLTGKLVYSTVTSDGGNVPPKIQMLDLVTGEITTIFAATDNAWIYYVAVSPDATKLVISYAPPSTSGSDTSTSLFSLPLEEGATPEILFAPPTPADRYIQVEWAEHGSYLYFVQYNHADQPADQLYPDYQISRMAYPGGQPEKILEQAFWPRLSTDSSKLVYITLDLTSGFNKLFLANADGTNPQELLLSGAPAEIIDAPIFSPDGASILFSAPAPVQAYQPNWLDQLLGVRVAKAHNVPSDWWSVPISGGTVTRLTQIQTIKLFASISPDQRHIASLSGEGIFVMGGDGSNLRQLLFDPGVTGTLRWIP